MSNLKRAFALLLLLACLPVTGLAAKKKTTPTPAPRAITDQVVEEVPEEVQAVLDLAYTEWETLAGKALKRSNKYTKWRNNYEWGWCGGFITWCMLQEEIPQSVWTEIEEAEVEGVVHVKEAGVGKLWTGYAKMNRLTNIPQKGFIAVYGKKGSTGFVHVGLVYDVKALGKGKYRLTTIEGNMSNTVRMYVHDYDSLAEKKTKNLTAIPKEEQTEEETRSFSYKLQSKDWYINCFLMPWIPEGMTGSGGETDEDFSSEESDTPAPTPKPSK